MAPIGSIERERDLNQLPAIDCQNFLCEERLGNLVIFIPRDEALEVALSLVPHVAQDRRIGPDREVRGSLELDFRLFQQLNSYPKVDDTTRREKGELVKLGFYREGAYTIIYQEGRMTRLELDDQREINETVSTLFKWARPRRELSEEEKQLVGEAIEKLEPAVEDWEKRQNPLTQFLKSHGYGV